MYVAPYHSVEELQKLATLSQFSAIRQRLQIVIEAKQAMSHEKIAMKLGCSVTACIRWVKRYNQEQLKGLETRLPKGKEPALDPEETRRFRQRIEAGPSAADNCCTLRGPEVQHILKEEFGKVRSLSAVYYLLHSLGYALLQPRPQHYKANTELQEEFKKKSKMKSITFVRANQTKKSRCGSKMKLALAKKVR